MNAKEFKDLFLVSYDELQNPQNFSKIVLANIHNATLKLETDLKKNIKKME